MIRLRSLWSRIDRFLAVILLTVGLASLLPARGDMAAAVGWLTHAAIGLLFFMHGARVSPAAGGNSVTLRPHGKVHHVDLGSAALV